MRHDNKVCKCNFGEFIGNSRETTGKLSFCFAHWSHSCKLALMQEHACACTHTCMCIRLQLPIVSLSYSCHQLPVEFLYRKLSYNVLVIIYAPRFLAELLSTITLVLSILSLTSAPKPAPWKVLYCIVSVLCLSFC